MTDDTGGGPTAMTDYEARAVAERVGIGPYWRQLRDRMVEGGAWRRAER